MKVEEGYVTWNGNRTYYRMVGTCREGRYPLVLLHGGPGSTHNYFELLDELAADGRSVIMYDQLGCGKSDTGFHPELWNMETWKRELMALREHLGLNRIHLLGQSFGGMLALSYVCDEKPEGIESLILSSTLPSSELWAREQHRMIRFLPEPMQQAIARAEETGNYEGKEYLEANEEFMRRHCAPDVTPESPECLRREKGAGRDSYLTAWGPNEFHPMGNLKDFEYRDRLAEIRIPALIISGTNDLCTPLVAKTMADGISDSRWELFENSRHMPFLEEREKYLKVVGTWMEEQERNKEQ